MSEESAATRARHARPSAAARWGLPLLAAGAALAVLAGGVVAWQAVSADDDAPAATPSTTTQPAPSEPTSAVPSEPAATDTALAEAGQLLAERSVAVRTGERRAFRTTADPQRRDAELAGFDRIAGVPFTRYRIQLESGSTLTEQQVGRGRFRLPVEISHRLPFDPAVVTEPGTATFVQRGERWYLSRVRPQRLTAWDLAPLSGQRSGRVLVVGAMPAADLAAMGRAADAAVDQVAQVWPGEWSRRVTVVVPRTSRDLARLLDVPSARRLAGLAVTLPAGERRVVRIYLNPEAYQRLVPLGQQILLRHEITHVAQDSVGTAGVPLWLVEGVAEYVGYRGSGVPASVVAAGLLSDVRAGKVPQRLTPDRRFDLDAAAAERRRGYEEAWTLSTAIADRYGERRLMRLYRAVARDTGPPRQRVERALDGVLGTTSPELVQTWQQWLREAA